MPMGGAGSRFADCGFQTPKPLIEIEGRPFLYWATRSVERFINSIDITFVVLEGHIRKHSIDKVIAGFFPQARVVAVDASEVQAGPVMTCLAGIGEISDDAPVLFNDCDHMFRCSELNRVVNKSRLDCDGALLTFPSDKPCYSYVRYEGSRVAGTVEKQVVSSDAICGAYLARSAAVFRSAANAYIGTCGYSELFVSGIYNVMCEEGLSIRCFETDFHLPFGTPEEYARAQGSELFRELA